MRERRHNSSSRAIPLGLSGKFELLATQAVSDLTFNLAQAIASMEDLTPSKRGARRSRWLCRNLESS